MSEAKAIGAARETARSMRVREETQAKYSVPRVDLTRWTLDTIDWRGDEVLLDIGAGAGSHYSRLMQAQPNIAYFALDLSPNLLLTHPGGDRLALGDAMRLPFGDDRFDIVIGESCPLSTGGYGSGLGRNQARAQAGGTIAGGGRQPAKPARSCRWLIRRAIVLLSKNGAQVNATSLASDAFALENGARILARHFYAVVRHDLPCQLIFDDVEPALEFLDSMREQRQAGLPDDVSWDDMMLIMRQQMTQLLQLLGKLELSLAVGALIASDRGGFIHEFVARKQAQTAE